MDNRFKTIYFIGIKGVGMSAMALVAKGFGYQVSGSDVDESFITDEPLEKAGIQVHAGFTAAHLEAKPDLVVIGPAYGPDNVEVQAAQQLGLERWPSSQFLGWLAAHQKTIAVAGTHGKTTTTALLTYLLYATGHSPSYIIGTGHIKGLPSHGAAGEGQYFITEADDYKRAVDDPRPKFLDLSPYAAIITIIEHDHPDLYPSLRDCLEAFYQFASRVDKQGFIVINSDDPTSTKLTTRIADRCFIRFGTTPAADYQIKMIRIKVGEPIKFRLLHGSASHGPFTLNLKGQHNLDNAVGAIVMAIELGVTPEAIQKLLPHFTGVERRYQELGRVGEQVIMDDYAHHPTSVRLTLEAARRQFKGKEIWCIFQSHTYSRTKALLKEFGTAFASADQVVITDIFASAREKEVTITPAELVLTIQQHHASVRYIPKEELVDFIEKNIPKTAVVLLMGAGDIYKVGQAYLARHGSGA